MDLETGKLYLTKPHTKANIGQVALLELNGVTSCTIYGSKDQQADVASMTPATEAITEDFYQTLSALPRYITFVGTVTRINIEGYDLVEIGDIS